MWFGKKSEHDAEYFRKVSILFFVPFLWITAPVVGYFLGYAVDYFFKTEEVFSFIFLILGIIAAARETYLIVRRAWKSSD